MQPKAGIEITPALREQIDGLAEGYANATVEANKLSESQEQAREAADFFKGSMMDAFQSMIPAIETGNSALDKFLNTLIEVVLQASLLGKGATGWHLWRRWVGIAGRHRQDIWLR